MKKVSFAPVANLKNLKLPTLLNRRLQDTVEPRLSGLVGTRRNSPDNRRFG